jgi:hypothetical protein
MANALTGRKFDTRVHIRNKETGQVERTQPYQLVVNGSSSEYIRDGVRFHPDGSQCDPNQKPMNTGVKKKADFDEAVAEVHDLAEKLHNEKTMANADRASLDEQRAAFEKEKADFEASKELVVETTPAVEENLTEGLEAKVEEVITHTSETVEQDTSEVINEPLGTQEETNLNQSKY